MGATAAGCRTDQGDALADEASGSGITTMTGTGTGGTGSTPATADEDSDASADDVKFDQAFGDLLQTQGCRKVDFLFVIDSSVSMADNQASLIASFPGFIGAIEQTLVAGSDYHIMVVDTDEASRCTPESCADPQRAEVGNVFELCIDDGDGGHACTAMFDACDTTIGAGVVHPSGSLSSNQECTIGGGHRYIVEGEPDLAGTFACLATLGIAGHPAERPMDALVAAVADGINAPDACNDGFLRDDAILVATFISDDANYEDMGTPMDWYEAVVSAKDGDAAAVVVLGLLPSFAGCERDGDPDGAHWAEFVGLFGPNGLTGSVCELDYAPFFTEAIAIIDTACDEFIPPG